MGLQRETVCFNINVLCSLEFCFEGTALPLRLDVFLGNYLRTNRKVKRDRLRIV
jgi:hypothetical protein